MRKPYIIFHFFFLICFWKRTIPMRTDVCKSWLSGLCLTDFSMDRHWNTHLPNTQPALLQRLPGTQREGLCSTLPAQRCWVKTTDYRVHTRAACVTPSAPMTPRPTGVCLALPAHWVMSSDTHTVWKAGPEPAGSVATFLESCLSSMSRFLLHFKTESLVEGLSGVLEYGESPLECSGLEKQRFQRRLLSASHTASLHLFGSPTTHRPGLITQCQGLAR